MFIHGMGLQHRMLLVIHKLLGLAIHSIGKIFHYALYGAWCTVSRKHLILCIFYLKSILLNLHKFSISA